MDKDLLEELLLSPCGMMTAGLVMYAAGNRATAEKETPRRLGAALAGAALIAVMAFGIDRRMELLPLAVGAAGFGLCMLGTSWIVLSIVFFMLDAVVAAMAAPVFHPKPETPLPPPPKPEPEPEPVPPLPPPPPPPSEAERAAAARERYQQRLQLLEDAGLDEIELQAGRDEAKKQYVNDLDKVMK